MTMKYKVFFGRKSEDNIRVREIKQQLDEILPNFPIKDVSEDVPNASNWKEIATTILQDCDMFVCVIGELTYASEPVDWEIREASQFNKPILVITLCKNAKLPPACKDLPIEIVPWNPTDIAGRIGELLLPRALFFNHDWSTGSPQWGKISQQYTLMVQSAESLTERRQKVITIYIAANSALLAGVGLLISFIKNLNSVWIAVTVAFMALLGIALSINWDHTISSYGLVSRAKWKVISALESFSPAQMFDAEWRVLEAKKYKTTTESDKQTAKFFLILYLVIFCVSCGIIIGQLIFPV